MEERAGVKMSLVFQKDGTLQEGIYIISPKEFYRSFVFNFGDSASRKKIVRGFYKYIKLVLSYGILHSVIIDGSFVTQELNPNDIDISLIIDTKAFNSLPEICKNEIFPLTNGNDYCQHKNKHHFYTHTCFSIPYYTSDLRLRCITRDTLAQTIAWWGTTRSGTRKGMLIMPFKKNAISEIEVILNEF